MEKARWYTWIGAWAAVTLLLVMLKGLAYVPASEWEDMAIGSGILIVAAWSYTTFRL
jgi:hypothetical protein